MQVRNGLAQLGIKRLSVPLGLIGTGLGLRHLGGALLRGNTLFPHLLQRQPVSLMLDGQPGIFPDETSQ